MSGLAGRRVALIGGAGFIGHHLALDLAMRGAEVSVIDSLQVNNLFAVGGEDYGADRDLYTRMLNERLRLLREAAIPVVVQDARDYAALGRMLERLAPQAIVHLAAVSHANRSNKDPFSTFDHSLRTLENALDVARGRVEHFVYLSSSMVYGDFLADPVEEDHRLDPIGIYGALKLAGERMVIAYNQVFDLPYTIVRPSALYGPRCVSRRVGQIFLENALAGRPLEVRSDGGGALDFTYVDDLVQGLRLAIERPESRGETFNLTFGGSRPIAELADAILAHFPDVERRSADIAGDPLTPRRGTLSIDKARRLLGYAPEYPLERGMAEYVTWYRSFVPERVPA